MRTPQTRVGSGELTGFRPAPAQRLAGIAPWCSSAGKRAFDLTFAALGLFVFLPLMAVVAGAIKLSSRGPALFRQQRVGRGGKRFQVLKFRSMHVHADRCGPGITRENDPRIFPLGRLIRKWKLDEFPQLFNVARGDMSLVGPRPDLPEFCSILSQEQLAILELRPGITGAATLKYHNEEAMLAEQRIDNITDYYLTVLYPEKIRLELDYARKASFKSDLRILWQTFTVLFA
jgi:lipopolysaccharide/colanic/teichoic acid biosynthesis glycosyltransferase